MNIDQDVFRMKRVSEKTNPLDGHVYWSWKKSLWITFHFLVGLIGGYLTFSWKALTLFLAFTFVTACLGHSLGMHRLLIHKSYKCPKWMEYLFIHFGTVFGMAGPYGMMRAHDIRDWAQRHPDCHDYLKHGRSILQDGWWQLHCDLALDYPPRFEAETEIANDKVYQFMDKTWMLQQFPWAILFYLLGGWPWVIWGICVRIPIQLSGHWLVGYFAHNRGSQDWEIEGAAVQGHNVDVAGLITMGEAWHNNHHAFPGSAKMGIYEGQADVGWWVLKILHKLGLVWDIKLPEDLPFREELHSISNRTITPELIGDAGASKSAI